MITRRSLAVLVAAAFTSTATPALADDPPPPLGRAAPAPPVPLAPRNPTMMVGGIVIAATGGALLHIAALLPVLTGTSERSAAGGMFLGGVVAIAAGVPLMIIGGKHVPVETAWTGAPGPKGWTWSF